MNWHAFEHDQAYVLGRLREGVYDAMETVTRVLETEFFECLLREGDFKTLAETYPTPRQREDVPLWVYLCSQIALRINAHCGFKTFPYVLPCSGLRDAFGPSQVRQAARDGGVCDVWTGFNDKNAYARETPCDPDFLRKMARDTKPDRLEPWYNYHVSRYYGSLSVYDADGIFIADGSYLFVPDNPRYQNSSRLLFDEENRRVSQKQFKAMSDEEKLRVRLRRCYREIMLLHTTWARDFYLYTCLRTLPGRAPESPQLLPMVRQFISAVGEDVMKILIHDRGFIDGATVAALKRDHHVDCVFPLKKNMDCWDEAWRLAAYSDEPWVEIAPPEPTPKPIPPERPEYIQRREEKRQAKLRAKKLEQAQAAPPEPKIVRTLIKPIRDLNIWNACTVPIHIVAIRDVYDTGKEEGWVLATPMDFEDPQRILQYYALRPTIEERIRQTKCFWDLTRFRSTSFPLVVNQVVFVSMAYSLVQIFLWKTGRHELARSVRDRLFEELLTEQEDQHAIYCDGRVAFLSPLQYTEVLLSLEEHARRKLLGKTRDLLARKSQPPAQPWRP